MADTSNSSASDATPNKDTVVTPDDKQVLIDDLKKTMHDMGRIPAILMAPVIAYVSSQYEKIPESRRATLHTIVTTLKTKGVHGLAALKTRFAEVSATHAAPTTTAPTSTPTVTPPAVQTPVKKTSVTQKPVAKESQKAKKSDTKKTEKKSHKGKSKKGK